MVSTYTDRLGLELQANGENPNNWGDLLNSNVISLVDEAIAGYAVVSVSSVAVTLTDNNGTADQSRNAALEFAGTLTADVTIVAPAEEKTWFINENTSGSFSVTMKTAGGTGVVLTQGTQIMVACDGTDMYQTAIPTSVASFTANHLIATSISTSTLTATGHVSANSLAVTSVVSASSVVAASATFSGNVSVASANITGIASISDVVVSTVQVKANSFGTRLSLTDAASISVALNTSDKFIITLGGNRTLAAPTGLQPTQAGSILVVQDGTGSRTLSLNSVWKFPAGTAPTFSTSINSVDRIDYEVYTSTAIHTVVTLDMK
jgi:hypothetical protein